MLVKKVLIRSRLCTNPATKHLPKSLTFEKRLAFALVERNPDGEKFDATYSLLHDM